MMILSTVSLTTTSSFPPLSLNYPPPQSYHRRLSSFTTSITLPQPLRRSCSTHSAQVVEGEDTVNELPQPSPPPPEDFKVLTAIRSNYNDITILETQTSKLLLLDSTHNVHSIFNKEGGKKWTDSYWDEFVTLPPIIPDGPIAIYGLGGGTAAELMLDVWPSLDIHGWEIDEILIHKAREHLGLSELEKRRKNDGGLLVRVGDALSENASVAGGYAGIIVDLFSGGRVLEELGDVMTWRNMREKLMPRGRIMVNCGGISENNGSCCLGWEQNYALRAISKVFDGELNWKLMAENKGQNFLGLTGGLPDLPTWSAALPDELRSSVYEWKIWLPS